MEVNQASSLGDSFNASSLLNPLLPVDRQREEPFQTFELKRTPSQSQAFPLPTPPPPVTQMSLAEIDSLISPIIRRKSEGFMQHEIKLMIEEIGKLRHILLSRVPSRIRLKKKAWEEVAHNMALRNPNEPQRSGAQIKKKWENIVLKTKKKIRDGQLTNEIEWNESTKMVMQFLAAAGQEMLQEQQMHSMQPSEESFPSQGQLPSLEMSHNPPNGSLSESQCALLGDTSSGHAQTMELRTPEINDNDRDTSGTHSVQMPSVKREENEEVPPSNFVDANAEIITATGSINDNSDENGEDEDDASSDSDLTALANSQTTEPNLRDIMSPTTGSHRRGRKGGALEKELIRQSRAEHALRMGILQMKHRYWQLKTDSLLRRSQSFPEDSRTQQ
ncbi:hypothetical protein Aperf_G00000021394 [Anoplocephala perfoliata]